MKLLTKTTCFREVIKEYDNYTSSSMFTRGDIPEGASLVIESFVDYQSICVYRDHPFNEQVKAAKAAKIAAHNALTDSYPTVKFVIEGWTPAKLAEMQTKVAQRVINYAAAKTRIEAATEVFNAAFEAQRLEILGEQHENQNL